MSRDDTSVLIILLVAAVSLVGVAFAASSITTQQSFRNMMGGGMMGQDTTADSGPGIVEWGILFASLAVFIIALSLFFRGRSTQVAFLPVPPAAGGPGLKPATEAFPSPAGPPAPSLEPVPEPALVKLLGEDERQMYLEIRDHGGVMLQRDLVSLGVWSKAKVTRVLDKLEAKGVVVREAHGMTNRVRILHRE